MSTTTQLLIKDHPDVGDDASDWKWLLVSPSAIASFAALLFGDHGAAVAFLAIVIGVIAFDQIRARP